MTHSHIDLGWALTDEELSLDAALARIEDIEKLAEADIDVSWVDEMFDRFDSAADKAGYSSRFEEERAIVEAEIARLEGIASRVDPDLIDNLIDEARLAGLYERRKDLRGGGR